MLYSYVNGRNISKFTLGTVQLGMEYGIANNTGRPDAQSSFELLREAAEGGVTSIDTSRAYGESEDVLGRFFKTGCSFPFITTKCNVRLPSGASVSELENEITASAKTSLDKLGVPKVDCMLLHNIDALKAHGARLAEAFERLLSKGYASMAGTSVYYPDEVELTLSHSVFTAIQVPASVFDQKLISGGYFSRLRERGMCVFVRSVFLQGLCFLNPDGISDSALKAYASPYILRLRELANKAGMSVAQLAVSYIRDVEGVTSLVLGAETARQVRENIGLIEGPALCGALKDEISRAFDGFNFEAVMDVLRRPKT